jgi:hypothetical protein
MGNVIERSALSQLERMLIACSELWTELLCHYSMPSDLMRGLVSIPNHGIGITEY